MATISTHNGSAAHRDHNIRNRNVTDKESHIDPEGVYEIWHDERLPVAYNRIFGASVERYNEKQKRPDRQIQNYLQNVLKDDRKHAVYEMIIGVYEDEFEAAIEPAIKREIMKKFVSGWKERNPNLELVGAYYHADEQGGPHVHIDYVPVAHGYKRGMDTQVGLVKALGEQGFEGKSTQLTAQILWQRRENEELERICNEHGIEVEHPQRGGEVKHLDTEIYKKQQELQELEEKLSQAFAAYENTIDDILNLQNEVDVLKSDNEKLTKQNTTLTAEVTEAQNELLKAQKDKETLEDEKSALRGDLDVLGAKLDKYQEMGVKVSEIDNIKAKTVLGGWVTLKSDDWECVKEQAKAYVANRDEVLSLREREEEVENKEVRAAYRKQEADEMYARQLNVNQLLEQSERKVKELGEENTKLILNNRTKSSEIGNLKTEISKKDREIEFFRQSLTKAVTAIASVSKAAKMLFYAEDDEYRLISPTRKQKRLLNGLAEYGARTAETLGFYEIGSAIRKHAEIDDDLQKFMKLQQQQQMKLQQELELEPEEEEEWER